MPTSLLFLPSTTPRPAGYVLLGSSEFQLAPVGGVKPPKITIYVYMKQ